jgi:cytochrome c peroxidase
VRLGRLWRGLALALASAWVLGGLQAAGAAAALLDFSPEERQQILQHGPWPPPPARDAGNALAGRPAAIALGQRLFFDTRLSPDGRLACASCHVPGLAFADGRARGQGRDTLDRHTPSLWNAGHQRWLGWDGAFDSLWSQALQPLRHPREMATDGAQVKALLQTDAALACAWRQSFGPAPAPDDEATLLQAAKAIGAFVATLQSGRTPFDDFRDALARRDTRAAAPYPLAAQRGLRLFIGHGRCSTCHTGPLFSNGEFADTGLPFFVRPGVVDAGRHGGISALLASPYNLLGPYSDKPSDAPGNAASTKTRHVTLQHRNFGEFKVPSLRNVADTPPYMHDGQLATLQSVIDHYDQLNLDRLHADGELILRPLQLTAGQRADLLAFLQTLSDPGARRWKPARPPRAAHPPCGKV